MTPQGYGTVEKAARVLNIAPKTLRTAIKLGQISGPDPATGWVVFEQIAREMNSIPSRQDNLRSKQLVCPEEHRLQDRRGVGDDAEQGATDPDISVDEQIAYRRELEELRLRRDRADVALKEIKAERVRFELAQSDGEFLDRNEVRDGIRTAMTQFRESFLQVGARLAPIITGLDDVRTIRETLDDEFERVLKEASNELRKLSRQSESAPTA